MRQLRIAFVFMAVFMTFSLRAEPGVYGEQRISRWWNEWTTDVSQTWNEPQHYDLYVPFLSWHARFMYDKEKTDNYNEMPSGGGFGISRYDDGLPFVMRVLKHHGVKRTPVALFIGYGWENGWYLDNARDFRLGLGVTAGITARKDFANYVPLPIVLPLFSAGYKNLNVQFTYIPGTYNNGNVLFAWLRYGF